MKYTSTRGGVRDVDFPTVVFSGYAPDGGLYVPQDIPIIDRKTLLSWNKLNYSRLTSKVLSLFVNEEVKAHLDGICDSAFSNFECASDPVPIKKVGDIYIAETYRGPTLAFKDIGLNILSQMMQLLLRLQNTDKRANVLVETSGDTGPAAASSVMLNTDQVNIFCMFPYKQVTATQAKQLTTAMPKNEASKRVVNVYKTDRNSDDQCLIIKNIFNDKEFVQKYNICAMNSINFVRIAAQICYYFYCYLQIVPRVDKEIIFSIPSGAFGNSCAASFAKAMGLPIKYIIPCCNENNIVFRTLMFGDFSSSFKQYHSTQSPAMDVQIAYNLERLFWLCFNMNGDMVKRIMDRFEKDAQNMEFHYTFDDIFKRQFRKYIDIAYCVSDAEIGNVIRHFVTNYKYLSCPHSACSLVGAMKTIQSQGDNDDIPLVAIATASPAKFPNIITRFFDGVDMDKETKMLLQNELYHTFLPKEGEKEQSIDLVSDQSPNTKDNWSLRWTQRLKNDIRRANEPQSKL